MRYVILDTETTGLEPHKGHRIIEIGCVEILNRSISDPSTPQGHFHTYINPERESDEGALRVHGLTQDFLSSKPLFAQVVDNFLSYVKDATVIIHNADFDCRFLDAELALLGLEPFKNYCHEIVDSLKVAREMFPGKRNSLDALCDRFQVQRGHRVLHGALLDSQLLAEVWLALTRGQDSLLMADEPPVSEARASEINTTDVVLNMTNVNLPLFELTPEDEQAHQMILTEIERSSKQPPLWQR